MPPFGFGLSMPNLRGGGAAGPFVPVVLVQEDWNATGPVIGRTPEPISGGGTWQENGTNPTKIYCDPFYARALVEQGAAIFRHSVTFTDVSMTALITPAYSTAGNAPAIIWARSTPGPNTDPDTGYYIECNDPLSGLTPITLVRRVAGGDTTLGTSGTSPLGQIVSFIVVGSSLTVKVGGTTVIQVTDASIAAAGYWGYGSTFFGNEEADSIAFIGPITIQTA